MVVNGRIFTKLLCSTVLVNKFYPGIHENSTKSSVADTGSRKDDLIDVTSTWGVLFNFVGSLISKWSLFASLFFMLTSTYIHLLKLNLTFILLKLKICSFRENETQEGWDVKIIKLCVYFCNVILFKLHYQV